MLGVSQNVRGLISKSMKNRNTGLTAGGGEFWKSEDKAGNILGRWSTTFVCFGYDFPYPFTPEEKNAISDEEWRGEDQSSFVYGWSETFYKNSGLTWTPD